MTDQQRWDFLRSSGFPLDTMPFLDALGDRGLRFDRAYTPMPVCSPARVSLLTGRYPQATGVRENWAVDQARAPTDLVAALRGLGYRTLLAGKNHSHLGSAAFERSRSYMHTSGPPDGRSRDQSAFERWLEEMNHGVASKPAPFPLECQFPHRIVSDAIGFLEEGADPDRPFFLWLSFPEPHNPYQVPEPYFSIFAEDQVPERRCGPEAAAAKGPHWRWMRRLWDEKRPGYDAAWRRYRANYCGMLRLIDDQLRRFVTFLEQTARYEDTLIVFVSDHGDYAGDYGLQRKGVGLSECLVHVPMVVSGPGVVAGRNGRDFVSLVDVMPTLCEAVGAEVPYGVQGRSLWPLAIGGGIPAGEFRSVHASLGIGGLPWGEEERPPLHFDYAGRTLDELNAVTQSGRLEMVRMDRWKLLFDSLGHGELYDVESDPAELTDLYDDPDHRTVRQELTEELLRWTVRSQDDLPTARYVPKPAGRGWYMR
jgi:arylsulfatase A-like enzyme